MSWSTVRAKYAFRNKNIRGVEAPLASATQNGVELRSKLGQAVWNPGDDVSGFKLVSPGDFVIGLRSFQHGISFSSIRGLVSPAYTVFDAVADVDLRYYKHYFRSRLLISKLENISQGIRQGRTIDTEAFFNMSVPVPPLEEQRRIADFLDAETARIDNLQRQYENLHRLSTERMRAVVDAELDTVDTNSVPIAAVCSRIIDCVNKTAPVADVDTPYKMIRTSNIGGGTVDLSGCSSVDEEVFLRWNRRETPRDGDVLLTREAPLGQVGMLQGDDPVFLGQRIMLYRADKGKILPEFLLYNLLGSRVEKQLRFIGAGSLHEHMRVVDGMKLRVICPALEEQRATVHRIRRGRDRSRRMADCAQQQIDLLAERRQSLITAAVTGQIDVSTASGRGIEE